MQGKLIMSELAKKLQASGGGSCLFDESCGYGFGVECTAPKEVISHKFALLKKEYEVEKDGPGLFMAGGTEAKWPCYTCIQINFVEPERE